MRLLQYRNTGNAQSENVLLRLARSSANFVEGMHPFSYVYNCLADITLLSFDQHESLQIGLIGVMNVYHRDMLAHRHFLPAHQ